MIGGPSHAARSPLFALARDITLNGAADVLEASALDRRDDCPRLRFLAACLRLEAAGQEEGAVARRIYSRSDLADDFATPDPVAAGRIIRVLNAIDPQESRAAAAAREGIHALCDLLAGPLGAS